MIHTTKNARGEMKKNLVVFMDWRLLPKMKNEPLAYLQISLYICLIPSPLNIRSLSSELPLTF